jgi:hypothetical protein
LQTVQVVSEKRSTETAQMSSHSISALEIKSVPMLLGEKDFFMLEPTPIYTNIKNGYGLFGAFVKREHSWELKDNKH